MNLRHPARLQDPQPTLQHWLEYWLLVAMVRLLGAPPRRIARWLGGHIGIHAYQLLGRLRRTGMRNLEIAFPERSVAERERILKDCYRQLGWQLAEFCRMMRYTAQSASELVRYEGFENFAQARARGKGVLVITGHLGAWELSSFYHSLMGHPMGIVIRRLDNPLVDRFVDHIRTLHGNVTLHKDDFARGLLTAMRAGRTVGILMDTNMTPPQGLFVPFFGVAACTASGLARVALKTGAAVLVGYLIWEPAEGRYVLRFEPELTLIRRDDPELEIEANTAMFTAALEDVIRRYPEQWLWMHRRWKTRPPGEKGLY